MKNFGYTININHNTNCIFSHSESDWSNLRNNSLISIDNDPMFYTVGKVEELNFITDFIIENNNLIIHGNYEHYFIFDDVVIVSYKEYELLTIKTIIDGGNGYQIGDSLSLDGGVLSVNVIDNTSNPTILQVEEVDGAGKIQKIKIINRGVYLEFPSKTNSLTGGHGKNANISIEESVIKNRKMIERQIVKVEDKGPNTVIELNYSLPKEVTNGKISLKKYIGYLTSNYVGEKKRNCLYHVVRDFSPNLGIPLLTKGSNKIEEIYNHAILRLEKKIQELESKINKLS